MPDWASAPKQCVWPLTLARTLYVCGIFLISTGLDERLSLSIQEGPGAQLQSLIHS